MGIVNIVTTGIISAGAALTPVNLQQSSIVVSGWNSLQPDNLQAITDGNSNSVTGWGRVIDIPNRAYFEVDLGSVSRYYVEARIGIRMFSSYGSGEGIWFIECPSDSERGIPVWSPRLRPTANEKIAIIPAWVSGRYLRIGAEDCGQGYVELRIYDLKVWKLLIES